MFQGIAYCKNLKTSILNILKALMRLYKCRNGVLYRVYLKITLVIHDFLPPFLFHHTPLLAITTFPENHSLPTIPYITGYGHVPDILLGHPDAYDWPDMLSQNVSNELPFCTL